MIPIENVLTITGRGTVVTGAVERGELRVGRPVEVVGLGETVTTVVAGMETFGKSLEQVQAGDNGALLLRGVKRDQVRRGQVVALPGSVRPHQRFRAQVYALSAAEGGRRKPFFSGYQPQFHFRTGDVSGAMEFDGMVLPGDTAQVTVELVQPVALDERLGFAVREGGLTVAAGTVEAVLD